MSGEDSAPELAPNIYRDDGQERVKITSGILSNAKGRRRMIRIVLISAGFISVTIALIMLQPSAPRQTALETDIAQGEATVTRQETDLQALSNPKPVPKIETPAKATQDTADPTPPSKPAVTAKVEKTTPKRPAESNLETMILSALKQGQSEDYISALVNDAAKKGKVEVPDTLMTADGRVDASALLASLSQPAEPEHLMHAVSPGDTLASISYRYYGRTRHGPEILAANIENLPSEEHLTVGQEIVIPRLQ